MKKFLFTFILPVLVNVGCSADEPSAANINAENSIDGDTKTLIAYFSAEGHTKAVAEAIQKETGADIFFIEPLDAYAANPYDDSDRIQNEAYNNMRPEVKTYLSEQQMAKYDTIFVGTPIWWHQPAMVVCTFLEHYDLRDKVIIPFVTFGARSYLNETMQRLYKSTPDSKHIPATLPEDLDPDNIRQPQNDDDGIDVPTVGTVKQWLERIGYGTGNSGVSNIAYVSGADKTGIYSMAGLRLDAIPEKGVYIMDGRKYIAQ